MSEYESTDYFQDEFTLTDLEKAKKISDTLSMPDRGYLIRYILWDFHISLDDLFTIYDCFLQHTAKDMNLPLFSRASINRIKRLLNPLPTSSTSSTSYHDCPKCHSSTIKNGTREGKQQYLCKKCKYQFVK